MLAFDKYNPVTSEINYVGEYRLIRLFRDHSCPPRAPKVHRRSFRARLEFLICCSCQLRQKEMAGNIRAIWERRSKILKSDRAEQIFKHFTKTKTSGFVEKDESQAKRLPQFLAKIQRANNTV